MRMPFACLFSAFSLLAVTPGYAQVSSVDADRLDMEIAWQAQVQMPKVGRGIVSSHLWIDSTLNRKYAVVELTGGRTLRVSAEEADHRGAAIGIEEAKKQVGERAARLLGKNDGFEVVEITIPQIRLVFVTSDGLVQTFDAETGAMLWSNPCGLATAPAHPGAVSSAGVSVIHGRNLYLLDWNSGKQLMNKELSYGSSVALAVCNQLAYVTDFRGRLQAYGLGETLKPWSSQIIGRAVGRPVALADQSYCAIASTDGYVYTLNAGQNPGIWTRYETNSSISGSLAAGNHAFYAGTGDGLLTKISVADRLGGLDWEYPAGETITRPALVVGKRVVAATESGAIHCIDDETGFSIWSKQGMRIEQPIATAGGNFLCSTFSGEIYAFDAETGTVVGRTSPSNIKSAVKNQINDRLYVVGHNGRLQCLRTRGAVLPTMIGPVVVGEDAPAESAPVAEQPATTAPAANPFNFGGEAASTAPAATPFGGTPAANPFGNSNPFGATEAAPAETGAADGAGGMGNPFGSGEMSNPFGGANPF